MESQVNELSPELPALVEEQQHAARAELNRSIGHEILSKVAFMAPTMAAIPITHVIEPGTRTEAAAAGGAFALSVASLFYHRYKQHGLDLLTTEVIRDTLHRYLKIRR